MSERLLVVGAALAALSIWPFALHLVLRRYGIASEWRQTFRLCAIRVGPLAPFLILIALPNLESALHVASLRDAWRLTQTIEDVPGAALIAVLHPIVVLAALFVLASIPVAVAERYRADPRQAIRAVAFALGAVLPLIAGLFIGAILIWPMWRVLTTTTRAARRTTRRAPST